MSLAPQSFLPVILLSVRPDLSSANRFFNNRDQVRRPIDVLKNRLEQRRHQRDEDNHRLSPQPFQVSAGDSGLHRGRSLIVRPPWLGAGGRGIEAPTLFRVAPNTSIWGLSWVEDCR